ncbi:hypothetical protein FIBSPDRAFT_133619 [Athelia psychrophila]|uniref:Uncharacterized protein n=1 Tax=Athelia psychrophila TaxID=1759441 RepID=A0A166CB20_9AGAM|nr:hypothetical protein FIBSPDRAFT_133619 [Fibularhizoctonia sp. CBS 109695]
MRDRPTPGHTQARTQAPPRYPPNALAQNAAQGPSPRLAQTQNTPQTQNNQHNQTQNNQHNQAQKSTQHQGWIHYGTQSQSQPQTYSNPRSQLSHHYQPQEMQRPWRQEQPSHLGQTSTEHYRHEQDLPTRISAGLAHYRPNASATATSIGPSPTAAGPSLTSTGNFSSSLQGGLGQQTARANAEASRGSSLNTAVQSHNPNLSSASTRTQQRNSVDSTQSNGQSTALTMRPIAPVLQGDFRRISTSTSQDSDRTHRMQDISAATNGGISRDTAIAIPLDVDSTLPVDPNRTVSNTRHLNPQLANTAPTAAAQNNIHHTANTKPGDDAIYLVPPSQSFFQARISEPSPFAQSAPSHNEPNGNSWNMPISPAHTSVSGSGPRTPASVNKKLLARDILRSFGRGDILSSLGGKRKRSEDRQPPDMSGKRARDKSPASSAQIASPLPAVAPVLVISDTTDEPQMALLAEEEEEADVQLIETMVTSPGLNLVRSADTQPDKSPQVSVATGAGVSMTPAVTASDIPLVAEPPKTREPLFLPSPTSSLHEVDMDQSHESQPLAHPQQGSDDAATSHIPVYTHYYEPHPEWPAEEVKPTLPSRCFVKVPEAPEWVKLYNQGRKERAEKSRRRRPSPIVISDSEDEIEQWEGEGEEGGKPSQRGNKIGADEERRQDEIVEQSTSAIRPQPPCKWKHCNVVMNSGNNLIAHLETHLRGLEVRLSASPSTQLIRELAGTVYLLLAKLYSARLF